jgi:hypothetical protein
MNLLSEENQRQSIEGERRLMNDPKYFSPVLRPPTDPATIYEGLRQAAVSAELVFNPNGGVTGVTTGLKSLDRRLGGL